MAASQIRALWNYRHFILAQVRRELKTQYAGSAFAWLWVFLPAIAQISIFTVVFSFVLQARLPFGEGRFQYSLHLLVSMLPWLFFLDIVNRCIVMFPEYAAFLKNLAFPRICLPAIAVLNASCNFAIQAVLAMVFMFAIGAWPGWTASAVLPLLALQTLLALGLGLTLGIANIYFRDVGKAFGIIAQFWFWLTPIIYPLTIMPETLRPWFMLNPLTPLIGAYQQAFVARQWPEPAPLMAVLALAAALLAMGLLLFRRHAETLVDEL